MKTRAELEKIITTLIEDVSIAENVATFLGVGVERAAAITDWGQLRGESDVSSDSNGILIPPPRCRKVRKIVPVPASGSLAAYEFQFVRELPTAAEHRLVQNYCVPYPASMTNEQQVSLALTSGSQSAQAASGESTFFDADDVGRELWLDGIGNEFEITAFTAGSPDTITIYPAAPSAYSSITATLGPAGRERWQLFDSLLNPVEDEVRVLYQKQHPPLVSDSSRLLIPCPYTAVWLALELCLQENKYDVDAQRLAPRLMELKAEEMDNNAFRKTSAPRKDSLFSMHSNRSRTGR